MINKKFQSAFTLIELLLGMVILSVISLALVSCFYSAMRLNQQVSLNQKNSFDVLMTVGVLQQDLMRFIPLAFTDTQQQAVLDFKGSPQEFSFWVDDDDAIKRVTYVLRRHEQQDIFELYRLEQLFDPRVPLAIGKSVKEQIVMSDLAANDFNCRYGYHDHGKIQWQEEIIQSSQIKAVACQIKQFSREFYLLPSEES